MPPAPEENGDNDGGAGLFWGTRQAQEKFFHFSVVNQNALMLGESKDDTDFFFPFSFSEEKEITSGSF